MEIEFNPLKDAANQRKHGISLAAAEIFEWATAHDEEDLRKIYPERRFRALGYIGDRLYMLIYCWRDEKKRIISLRKANRREEKHYAET
jgi:uncharacterized DUF497 family protein